MATEVTKAANIEGTLHVDRYLNNYSLAYVQDQANFVAYRAASMIPVNNKSDEYVEFERSFFFRDDAQERPLGGRPAQVSYGLGSGTYVAREYALEHRIDDRQRRNTDQPINLDEKAAQLLTQKQMIRMDRHWATTFFVAGAWSNQLGGVAASPSAGEFLQFDQAGSDPIGVVDREKETIGRNTGMMPNTLVLGARVRRILRTHPDITDRIKHTQLGVLNDQLLAQLFDVENVVTPRSIYTSSAEGAVTQTFAYTTDEDAMWLGYIDPNPTIDSPTAIACFAWTGLLPGAANDMGGVIQRGREVAAHSDYFQSRHAWDMKKVADELGVFFGAAVASAA